MSTELVKVAGLDFGTFQAGDTILIPHAELERRSPEWVLALAAELRRQAAKRGLSMSWVRDDCDQCARLTFW